MGKYGIHFLFIFTVSTIAVFAQDKQQSLFTVEINTHQFRFPADISRGILGNQVDITVSEPGGRNEMFKRIISITNNSKDTLHISNFVPYGADSSHVFISGLGDHPLSRTHLFIPGKIPVNVVVPVAESAKAMRGCGRTNDCRGKM